MSRGEADLVAAIRGELAAVLPDRPCCRRVELDALADAGGRREEIAIARTIHRLSAALEGEVQPRSGLGAATPAARAAAVAERLSAERAPRHCRIAYLRGRILARGSLSIASGSVHLEVVVSSTEGGSLRRTVDGLGLGGAHRLRRGRSVVVWKGRNATLHLLRSIGGGPALMELEARGIAREMRGEMNRSVNAETANLLRSVRAGVRQASAAKRLLAAGALDTGSVAARIAHARIAAPDASLATLAEELEMTRSALQRGLAAIERASARLEVGEPLS
ncbi:MAG: DNA-binding protein WhiA [Candidatus Limnocylindrus sp.]